MADKIPAPATTSDDKNKKDYRFEIAIGILKLSSIGVIVIAIVVLIAAGISDYRTTTGDNLMKSAQLIFTAVLPLLGSWVGTILAFYFSRENFESATKSVTDMAKHLTDSEKLVTIPVTAKMIARKNMLTPPPKADDQINLQTDIIGFCDQNKVNRVPILDASDRPRYIIHRSAIEGYNSRAVLARGVTPDQLKAKTLQNLFDEEPALKKVFEGTFAIVKEDATLSDAKAAMEKVDNCLDVFVTKNGTKNEPVTGYLTNLMISEAAKA